MFCCSSLDGRIGRLARYLGRYHVCKGKVAVLNIRPRCCFCRREDHYKGACVAMEGWHPSHPGLALFDLQLLYPGVSVLGFDSDRSGLPES